MSKSNNTITDPVIVKHLTEHPLSAFSFYTQAHFNVLKNTGNKINTSLDNAFLNSHFKDNALHGIEHNEIQETYGLFWLWILGAYEITRTMSEANKCFTPDINVALQELKRHLAIIRMPFAKQQPKNKNKPIGGEASISDIDGERKDICFSANNTNFWVRNEIKSFESQIESITIQDIISTYKASYEL